MARAGLGPGWSCAFANDIDNKKAASYDRHWGDSKFLLADVADLSPGDLPGVPDLAWASFPCQDLSLAGSGAGLRGKRSGTFWPFWELMRRLDAECRAPSIIVLENVKGTLTSHGGADFAAIITAVAKTQYRVGALVIDAVQFVPQSRPRLFIVAVRAGSPIPTEITRPEHDDAWHPRSLVESYRRLPESVRAGWVWWHLPQPAPRKTALADLIEANPSGVCWHTRSETSRLLNMMSSVNRLKVMDARKAGRRIIGTIYKRTRTGIDGRRGQRAEVRFDGIAGCLRTPQGGSSRQTIIVVDGNTVRSRLLSPREAARLMGLPGHYELPDNYNEAYHLSGDGVVVPVVRHLAAHILEPVLAAHASNCQVAA